MKNINTSSTFINEDFDNHSFVLKQDNKYILFKMLPIIILSLGLTGALFIMFSKTYAVGAAPIIYLLNLIPMLYSIYMFFYYRSFSYEITKERIIVKSGIIFINTSYQEMYRIEYYEKEENIFTRFLQVFNLKVEVREMNTERIIKIEGIGERYSELPHILRELVQRAKMKYKAITLN